MLTVRDLTKRYGDRTAVDGLTFTVEPGRVTGFLGPNGAGKSTTMRLLLGLARPTSGEALINGHEYGRLTRPAREVGALLSPEAAHPGRTARAHLTAKAVGAGIPRRRVEEVLEEAGLTDVARRRVGGYSLGMRQRLGVADALLGDPGIVLLDEPVNGLDLDGVRWMRALLRRMADEGRTVLLSSHMMSEMEAVADHLVVVGRGRLVTDAPIGDVITAWSRTHVLVCSPDAGTLRTRLERSGPSVRVEAVDGGEEVDGGGTARVGGTGLRVFGLEPEEVGDHAYAVGARVHGLRSEGESLEQAYLGLTAQDVEYGSHPPAGSDGGPTDAGGRGSR